eukprot:s2221_g10.t1
MAFAPFEAVSLGRGGLFGAKKIHSRWLPLWSSDQIYRPHVGPDLRDWRNVLLSHPVKISWKSQSPELIHGVLRDSGKSDDNKTGNQSQKGVIGSGEPTPPPLASKKVDAADGALMSILIGVGVTLVFFLGLYCTLQLGRRRSQQQEPQLE